MMVGVMVGVMIGVMVVLRFRVDLGCFACIWFAPSIVSTN